jgi:hypothetical protein
MNRLEVSAPEKWAISPKWPMRKKWFGKKPRLIKLQRHHVKNDLTIFSFTLSDEEYKLY